jgi:hypothetical protein
MNSKEVLTEIRSLLGFSSEEPKEEVEFESAMLTDGTTIKWTGELAVGTAILVETAEGDISAPNGTHEVEGGMLVSTMEGLVTEIVEPEVEEEVEMDVTKAKELMSDMQKFADLNQLALVVKFMFDDMYGWRIKQEESENKISELASIVAQFNAIKEENVKLKEAFSKTISLVEALAESPSATPIEPPKVASKKEAQFENLLKFAKSINK